MMEDKRREELKDIIDEINHLEKNISFYEDEIDVAMDTLEFLYSFHCHRISFDGSSDEGEFRENVPINLRDNDIKEVEYLIEEKLRNQIEEYENEISKTYQKLSELLK